ncbi:caspase family protein [Nocardia callitridis]|uniref:Caspase family protein n=1 Tax=Nocardia callitridis TaxID=648753 RepID=A0ABP9K3L9_9NOCA
MDTGRALLVGIGRFDADLSGGEVPLGESVWSDLPFVDEVVPPVAAALSRLGYATDVRRDIGGEALWAAVAGAIGSARVVYVASHGKPSGSNPHRVDVVPSDARVGPGTNAAQWVDDAQESGVPTLFLLDLCRSGRAAALPHLVHGSHAPANAWVIAASGAGEDAYDGRFSIALAEVLQDVADTGLDTDPSVETTGARVVVAHSLGGIGRTFEGVDIDEHTVIDTFDFHLAKNYLAHQRLGAILRDTL